MSSKGDPTKVMFALGFFPATHGERCCRCDTPADYIAAWLSEGEPVALPLCIDHADDAAPMQECLSVAVTRQGVLTKKTGATKRKPKTAPDAKPAKATGVDAASSRAHQVRQGQLGLFGGATA